MPRSSIPSASAAQYDDARAAPTSDTSITPVIDQRRAPARRRPSAHPHPRHRHVVSGPLQRCWWFGLRPRRSSSATSPRWSDRASTAAPAYVCEQCGPGCSARRKSVGRPAEVVHIPCRYHAVGGLPTNPVGHQIVPVVTPAAGDPVPSRPGDSLVEQQHQSPPTTLTNRSTVMAEALQQACLRQPKSRPLMRSLLASIENNS